MQVIQNILQKTKTCLKNGSFSGAPDRSRTHNLRSRNPALYPVEATGAINIL